MSTPEETAATLNEHRGGWNESMDLRFVRASGNEVVAELDVEHKHHQPYGIVHGGVLAGIIETTCSVGAALVGMERNQNVVGLENSTSFIRAARSGKLSVVATPVTRGRKSQVWEAKVLDADQRIVASGRVRLLCLDADTELAGSKVSVE